jgi:hypothetical protein
MNNKNAGSPNRRNTRQMKLDLADDRWQTEKTSRGKTGVMRHATMQQKIKSKPQQQR